MARRGRPRKGYRVLGPYLHFRRWRIELIGPDGHRTVESFFTEEAAKSAAKAARLKLPGRINVETGLERYEQLLVRKGNRRKSIDETAFTGEQGGAYRVSCTFGVAGLGPDRSTPGALINGADQALYEGKKAGRNRVIVKKT